MRLGIATPAGALALLAVAVLVALHLWDRRRRVVPVSTLFLWRQLPAHDLERRRFRPDLLFLTQLVLVLALAGGLLRPYVVRPLPAAIATRLILVIDVSASMQAREAEGPRFALARARAAARVRALAAGAEAMVVTAADRAHVALPWTADHAAVAARLDAIAPLATPTDLAGALAIALGEARARPGTRVAVFTDLPREASGLAPGALAALDWTQVGTTDDNLAIAALTVDEPPFRPAAEATATVTVRNHGHLARRAALEARVGPALWARRELVLPPHGSDVVTLTAPPASGLLTVTLDAGDALAVDDVAVAELPASDPLDVLVVTDSRELAATFARIAAAVAGSRVETVDRVRFDAERPGGDRPVVFDRFVPAEEPARAALYVAPPPENALCPGAGTVDGAVVIDWDDDHAALGGLGALQALEVGRATRLAAPPWGAAIVLAASRRAAFPLLVAGERDGRRVACLAAELAATPLASADRLPLLLLTLGALRWLGETPVGHALAVETGVPVLLGAGPTGPIDRDGLRVAGDPAVLVAERTGVFRVGPPDGPRLVLANLFDDRESDIGRSGAGEWPATATPGEAPRADGRPIGAWLYAAGAVLLAVEWALWLARGRA